MEETSADGTSEMRTSTTRGQSRICCCVFQITRYEKNILSLSLTSTLKVSYSFLKPSNIWRPGHNEPLGYSVHCKASKTCEEHELCEQKAEDTGGDLFLINKIRRKYCNGFKQRCRPVTVGHIQATLMWTGPVKLLFPLV